MAAILFEYTWCLYNLKLLNLRLTGENAVIA